MDEKITTSAAENAESTAQAEQAAATAQSGAQDGTATEAVAQSEPQAKQKAETSGNSETGKADGGKSGGAEPPVDSDNSQCLLRFWNLWLSLPNRSVLLSQQSGSCYQLLSILLMGHYRRLCL